MPISFHLEAIAEITFNPSNSFMLGAAAGGSIVATEMKASESLIL